MINVQVRTLEPNDLIEVVEVSQTDRALTQGVLYLLLLQVPLIGSPRILDLLSVAKEALEGTSEALLRLLLLEFSVSFFSLASEFFFLSSQGCLHDLLEL